MSTEQKQDHAREQAEAQLSSIKEMVAALNCDYDRLEELRDERNDYDPEDAITMPDKWEEAFPEEAEELKELEEAAGDCESRDDAQERISEDPLSVQVRSGWANPGEEMVAEEFEILLCTGGPACRIRGELDQYKQPCRAWLEYQDWGTPWTEYITTGEDHDAILAYCQQFYFGD